MAHSVPCVVWRSAWLACVAIALRARTAAATKRIELARPELPPLGGQEQELEFSKAADPNEPEGILQRRRLTGAFSIHIPQPWYSSERRPINDWKGNVPLLGSTPEELFRALRPEIYREMVAHVDDATKSNLQIAKSLAAHLDTVYDFNNIYDWSAVVWDDQWEHPAGFQGKAGEAAWIDIAHDCNEKIPPNTCKSGGAVLQDYVFGDVSDNSKSVVVFWHPSEAPSHDPMDILHLIVAVNDCLEKQQPPLDLRYIGTCMVNAAYDEDALEGTKAVLLVPGSISESAAPEGGVFLFTNPFGSEPADALPPVKVVVLK